MTRGRRRQALKRRMAFLAGRLATTERHQASAYDGAELSALEWVLEREERLVALEALVEQLPPSDVEREMARLIRQPYGVH